MENNSNSGVYFVHVLILIFSCALMFPAVSCFNDGWVMFGSIIIILAVASFVLGILGISDEQATAAKRLETIRRQKEEQERIKAEQQRIASLTKHDIVDEICHAVLSSGSFSSVDAKMVSLTEDEKSHTLEAAFNNLLKKFLADEFIDDEEETLLHQFMQHFKYTGKRLIGNESYDYFSQICRLKQFFAGKPLTSSSSASTLINFQKGEEVIYEDFMVDYYEDLRGLRGGTPASPSARKIGDANYYDRSGFEHSYIWLDNVKLRANGGRLILTNKNIYFHSPEKAVKIPYNKVLTYTPYSSALCLQKDGITAKPQIFKGVDGWIVYNIVKNTHLMK